MCEDVSTVVLSAPLTTFYLGFLAGIK